MTEHDHDQTKKEALHVSEVIKVDDQTYYVPLGHATVEGKFAGRMALETSRGDFIVTEQPLEQSLSEEQLRYRQAFETCELDFVEDDEF